MAECELRQIALTSQSVLWTACVSFGCIFTGCYRLGYLKLTLDYSLLCETDLYTVEHVAESLVSTN